MKATLATYAWLLVYLPESFARLNVCVLGEVLWAVRGRLICRNLQNAFPLKTVAWSRRVGRKSCRRTIEMALFSIASPLMSRSKLRSRIIVDGSMLDPDSGMPPIGPGVVLFVPHLTMFESIAALPTVSPEIMNREWVVIYRPINQPIVERWIREGRERFGMQLVSRRNGVNQLMGSARNGQVVVVLFDQTTQSGSLWNFFNSPCAVSELPGLIVQRFKCQARLCWTERTGFWRSRIHSVALFAKDSASLTIESHAWLEAHLRISDNACADWLWAHNRWKHAHIGLRPLLTPLIVPEK